MNEALLIREDQGPIATLTMNNAKALNALSEEMLQALQDQPLVTT